VNHWHFIIGAYAITALVLVVEIVAVRLRYRAALAAAANAGDLDAGASHAPPAARVSTTGPR
jgi:heme exporter protein CcmD